MGKKILIILTILLSGCSYHSVTEADVQGKNIRYPLGLKTIKGDATVRIRREMSINHNTNDGKYLHCLDELNQCVIENQRK